MATRKYTNRAGPEAVAAYRRDHPDVSERDARRILRGHGYTAEHGKIRDFVPYPDRDVYETNSGQAARRLVSEAARAGQRIAIGYTDDAKSDRPRWLYTNPGHGKGITAKYLMYDKANPNRIDGEQNLKKWLAKQHVGGTGGASPGGAPGGGAAKKVERVYIAIYK